MCSQPKSADELALESRKQQVDTLRDYAWSWFAYHAAQRTSMFNYSLIAAALFSAAFGTAAGKSAKVAGVVAFVGAIVTFSFWLIDGRNRDLVSRAESVLTALEKEIFVNAAPAPIIADLPTGILTVDHTLRPDGVGFWKNYWVGKHKVHLRFIQGLLILVFLCGAVTAFKYPDVLDLTDHDTKVSVSDLKSQIAMLQTTVEEANRRSDKMQGALQVLQPSIDRVRMTPVEPNTPESVQKAKRPSSKGNH
jgi:hypothetical protein